MKLRRHIVVISMVGLGGLLCHARPASALKGAHVYVQAKQRDGRIRAMAAQIRDMWQKNTQRAQRKLANLPLWQRYQRYRAKRPMTLKAWLKRGRDRWLQRREQMSVPHLRMQRPAARHHAFSPRLILYRGGNLLRHIAHSLVEPMPLGKLAAGLQMSMSLNR